MPGVAYIDHGAKWDPIDLGVIDRGGAINTIVPSNTTRKTRLATPSAASWSRSKRPTWTN